MSQLSRMASAGLLYVGLASPDAAAMECVPLSGEVTVENIQLANGINASRAELSSEARAALEGMGIVVKQVSILHDQAGSQDLFVVSLDHKHGNNMEAHQGLALLDMSNDATPTASGWIFTLEDVNFCDDKKLTKAQQDAVEVLWNISL